ncbi:hypothetical protein, partial [Cellulomonas septica]|uniref:hypothetical protein n=1 Tax=Cellulomonas septica TaxID=285080 RepID=UPI001FEC3C09
DVAVLLGPGVNIKRTPLCGRNFEYVSEDPVVAGEIGVALVDGRRQKDGRVSAAGSRGRAGAHAAGRGR